MSVSLLIMFMKQRALVNTSVAVLKLTLNLDKLWCPDFRSSFSVCLSHQVFEILAIRLLLLNPYCNQCKLNGPKLTKLGIVMKQ